MIEYLKNKKIGVFFGGQNPEHEISIITGQFIISNLKKMGFLVSPVYISKEGVWYSAEDLSELKFFKKDFDQKLKSSSPLFLNLKNSKKKLVLENKKILQNKKIEIDFVFPALHGLLGEDGTLQGLCEFFKTPYAGANIFTSSVAIDKVLTKNFFNSISIPTTKHLFFEKENYQNNQDQIFSEIENTLSFPIFIKPARAGSSIGISKVKKPEDLKQALDLAFYYDQKIIVENSVENIKDLTCAVLSGREKNIVSEIQESVFSSDLFDYSVKYLEDGGAQTGKAKENIIIPANINKEQEEKIKSFSKEIFEKLKGNGNIRIDFLLNTESGEIFANEINTLPGTLYHHLWEKSGISIEKVIEKMLKDGIKSFKKREEIKTEFNTDVLEKANSMKLKN